MIKQFWDYFSGYKTYLISFSLIIYSGAEMYFGLMDSKTATGYIYGGLIAIGFRSALAKIATQIAGELIQKLSEQGADTTPAPVVPTTITVSTPSGQTHTFTVPQPVQPATPENPAPQQLG